MGRAMMYFVAAGVARAAGRGRTSKNGVGLPFLGVSQKGSAQDFRAILCSETAIVSSVLPSLNLQVCVRAPSSLPSPRCWHVLNSLRTNV